MTFVGPNWLLGDQNDFWMSNMSFWRPKWLWGSKMTFEGTKWLLRDQIAISKLCLTKVCQKLFPGYFFYQSTLFPEYSLYFTIFSTFSKTHSLHSHLLKDIPLHATFSRPLWCQIVQHPKKIFTHINSHSRETFNISTFWHYIVKIVSVNISKILPPDIDWIVLIFVCFQSR